MFVLMSLFQAQAGDMEVTILDPRVTEVQLNCGGRVLKSALVNGVAKFTGSLGDCTVSVTKTIGTVTGNDKYTCDHMGCIRNAVEHLQVPWAADRVIIILTDASTNLLELTCPSGYRNRARVNTNTAVFDGVPSGEDCELYWKGSAPGRGRKLRPGTWYCNNDSGTGVCSKR